MDMNEYQELALKTNQYDRGLDPGAVIGPLLGLATETGSILHAYKRFLRDRIDYQENKEFMRQELGDLLWYMAALARSQGLTLEEIAQSNIERIEDLYDIDTYDPPSLDAAFPEQERFPRRLVVKYSETEHGGQQRVWSTLIEVVPNAFPDGRIEAKISGGKPLGHTVGQPLGDPLTNNSRRKDAYRYHDAVHMAFMAVLGWSPLMRALLRIKRKSQQAIDEAEDGARAIFLEEGLVAALAQLSKRRQNFFQPSTVDGEVLDIVVACVDGLEVAQVRTGLWRKAISQGFVAMSLLDQNHGGYLIADLDKGELEYTKHQHDVGMTGAEGQ